MPYYASPFYTMASTAYPTITPYVNQPTSSPFPVTINVTTANTGSNVQAYVAQQLMSNHQALGPQTTGYSENYWYQPPTLYQQNGYFVPPLWLTDTMATFGTTSSWQDGILVPTPDTPEARAQRKRAAKLDDRAAARAKALLLEHLDDVQRAEYEENRYFHVIGQSGKVYRLKHGIAGNIYELGLDGNELHKYCVHFRDQLPAEDHMLGQLLRLRFDEEALLATANRHW